MAARHEAGIAQRYLQKAVRPTFADGKIDLGSLPEYEIGKWKTNRRKEAQTAPSERPAHNSALNRGSKFNSVKVCRSRFTRRRRLWMRPKSAAVCTCTRYGADPKTSDAFSRGDSGGGVRRARKSNRLTAMRTDISTKLKMGIADSRRDASLPCGWCISEDKGRARGARIALNPPATITFHPTQTMELQQIE